MSLYLRRHPVVFNTVSSLKTVFRCRVELIFIPRFHKQPLFTQGVDYDLPSGEVDYWFLGNLESPHRLRADLHLVLC